MFHLSGPILLGQSRRKRPPVTHFLDATGRPFCRLDEPTSVAAGYRIVDLSGFQVDCVGCSEYVAGRPELVLYYHPYMKVGPELQRRFFREPPFWAICPATPAVAYGPFPEYPAAGHFLNHVHSDDQGGLSDPRLICSEGFRNLEHMIVSGPALVIGTVRRSPPPLVEPAWVVENRLAFDAPPETMTDREYLEWVAEHGRPDQHTHDLLTTAWEERNERNAAALDPTLNPDGSRPWRHLRGRTYMVPADAESALEMEIWDRRPELLVRFTQNGQPVREVSVRGGALTNLDFSSDYARIDDRIDPEESYQRAIGELRPEPEFLAELRRGVSQDPPGTLYIGHGMRVVIDDRLGFLRLVSDGRHTQHFDYELDEWVSEAPTPTNPAGDTPAGRPAIPSESVDYDPANALAAFGLTSFPELPGYMPEGANVFGLLSGGTFVELRWQNAAGQTAHAQTIDRDLRPEDDLADVAQYNEFRAKVPFTPGHHLQLRAPDQATLSALRTLFARPTPVVTKP